MTPLARTIVRLQSDPRASPVLQALARWLPSATHRTLTPADLQRIDAYVGSGSDLHQLLPAVLPLPTPVWYETEIVARHGTRYATDAKKISLRGLTRMHALRIFLSCDRRSRRASGLQGQENIMRRFEFTAGGLSGYIIRVKDPVITITKKPQFTQYEVVSRALYRIVLDGETSPVAPLRSFGRNHSEAGQWLDKMSGRRVIDSGFGFVADVCEILQQHALRADTEQHWRESYDFRAGEPLV